MPPEPVLDASAIAAIDRRAMAALGAFPGLSIALARHGQVLYAQGFGIADPDTGEAVQPMHLFRIASLAKPITAVAVAQLIERRRVRADDKVFGPLGILRRLHDGRPLPRFVADITVEHLLTHAVGGWRNDGSDPMFRQPGMNHRQLIAWTLAHQPLLEPPGRRYVYSNFGYCLLGRIIEAVTGEAYADVVHREILAPCGAGAMRIAGNTLAERAPGEVAYHNGGDGDPYGMNVARMDSHGGWIASASDVARFLTWVDGVADPAQQPELLRVMTATSRTNVAYTRGWHGYRRQNWWHGGGMPGTAAMMVRTGDGTCAVALANGSRNERGRYDSALAETIWQIVDRISLAAGGGT